MKKDKTVLLNDLFIDHIVDRVKQYTLIVDDRAGSPTLGQKIPLPNLFFLHSSLNEFNDDMLKLTGGKEEDKKFPFIWINNGRKNVIYEFNSVGEQIITVKQMLVGTMTKNNYSSEQRTEKVFRSILNPLVDTLMYYLSLNGGNCELIDESYKFENHYFYGKDENSNPFNDFIDVVEVTDFKLLVKINNC